MKFVQKIPDSKYFFCVEFVFQKSSKNSEKLELLALNFKKNDAISSDMNCKELSTISAEDTIEIFI